MVPHHSEIDSLKADRTKPEAPTMSDVAAIVLSYPLRELTRKRISRMLVSKFDADDVSQDLMLTLFRTVDPQEVVRLHGEGHLRIWLITVIRRVVTALVRRLLTTKRGGGLRTLGEDEQRHSGQGLNNVVDQLTRSPLSVLAVREAESAIITALITLEPKYKRALSLRYLEDLSIPEVAAKMGHSIGTVRGLIQRGAKMLRGRMGPADRWFSKADSEEQLWQMLGDPDAPGDNGDTRRKEETT